MDIRVGPASGATSANWPAKGPSTDRFAIGVDRKPILGWRYREANILEPRHRLGEHQRGAGPGIGDARLDREGTVIDMPAAARDLRGARADAAIDRESELVRVDAQAIEIERCVSAHRNSAAYTDRRAGKIGQGGVGDRCNARVELGRKTPRGARGKREIDHGRAARGADIVQRQALRAHRSANPVASTGEIAAQREVGCRAGERQPQIVRQQCRTRQYQGAAAGAVDKSWIDHRIAAGNPGDRQIQRQGPTRAIIARGAFLPQAGEHGSADVQFAHARLVGDGEIVERSVERGGQPRIAQRNTIAQHRRIAHPHHHLEVVRPIVGQIDQPFGRKADFAASHYGRPVEHPVVDGDIALERHLVAKCFGWQAGQEYGRVDRSQQAEPASAVGQLQGGDPFVFAADEQCAVPLRPGAIAAHAHVERSIEPGERGNRPVRRGGGIQRKIEIVAIGFGVDQQHHPVTRAQTPVKIEQQPAVIDLSAPGDVDPLRVFSGDAAGQREIVDHQFLDRNVEAR
ncbi:hypothetical protein WKH79_07420 [Qipengyuania sp. GPGPB31]|uniref:hypothetical protein n=1 Tax=Qipengyuania sp. GPGPB31 TaxID=3023518 RepID=UPI003134518E